MSVHKFKFRQLLNKIKTSFLVVFGFLSKFDDGDSSLSAAGDNLESGVDHGTQFGKLSNVSGENWRL